MKLLKVINELLMLVILIMSVFLLFKLSSKLELKEDLNNDGVVNSADLLYLRNYLIKQSNN